MEKNLVLEYGHRKIPMTYYSSIGIPKKFRKNCVEIKIKGIGEDNDQEREKAEEIALTYLIHDAIEREKVGFHLEEIDNVKQTARGHVVNGHLEIEIILEGIAIFKKS